MNHTDQRNRRRFGLFDWMSSKMMDIHKHIDRKKRNETRKREEKNLPTRKMREENQDKINE